MTTITPPLNDNLSTWPTISEFQEQETKPLSCVIWWKVHIPTMSYHLCFHHWFSTNYPIHYTVTLLSPGTQSCSPFPPRSGQQKGENGGFYGRSSPHPFPRPHPQWCFWQFLLLFMFLSLLLHASGVIMKYMPSPSLFPLSLIVLVGVIHMREVQPHPHGDPLAWIMPFSHNL